jgi:hypothetical protein
MSWIELFDVPDLQYRLWQTWAFFKLCLGVFAAYITYILYNGSYKSNIKLLASIFLLMIGTCIVYFPNLLHRHIHIDESQHIAEAWTLAEDPRFWLSVDGTTVGPLPLFAMLLIKLTGFEIHFFSVRLLGLILWIASALLVFRILKFFFSDHKALAMSVPLFVTIAILQSPVYIGYNGEPVEVFLLLLSTLLGILCIKNPSVKTWMFLTGFVLVLVPFTKIQAGPVAFIMGMYIFVHLLLCRQRVHWLLAGVTIPLIVFSAYLWISNTFYDFWQSYILNNLAYASTGEGLAYKKGFFYNIGKSPFLLLKTPETRILYLTTAISIFWFFILRRKFFWFFGWIKRRPEVGLILILYCMSLLVIILPGNLYYHYALLILCPSVLMLALFLPRLAGRRNVQRLIYSFVLVLLPSAYSAFELHPFFERMNVYEPQQATKNKLIAKVKKYADPGQKLAIWGWETYLYPEAGLSMGTREAHTQRQILSKYQQNYYLSRYLFDLKRNQPEVFVECTVLNQDYFNFQKDNFTNFPEISAYIRQHYTLVAHFDSLQVYKKRK